MPIIKSAKKAARQAETRTANNVRIKKDIKAAFKTFKADPTPANLSKAQSEYDKAVKKGLLKKNTASRRKAAIAKIAKVVNKVEKATEKPAKKATPAKKVAEKKPAAKKAPAKKTATAKTPAKKPAAKKTTTKKAEK